MLDSKHQDMLPPAEFEWFIPPSDVCRAGIARRTANRLRENLTAGTGQRYVWLFVAEGQPPVQRSNERVARQELRRFKRGAA